MPMKRKFSGGASGDPHQQNAPYLLHKSFQRCRKHMQTISLGVQRSNSVSGGEGSSVAKRVESSS
eukprot:2143452-Amphidinium_carterae.1